MRIKLRRNQWAAMAVGFCAGALLLAAEPARRILVIAGPASHGKGEHQFPAGARLLAENLGRSGLPVSAEVSVGWPQNETAVAAADLVVLYSDGLEDHVAKGSAAVLRRRLEAGKNLAVLHFALEPPTEDAALAQLLLDATGARFEAGWSVNPVWRLQATPDPSHPVAHGVGALDVEDEWYFHLRFADGPPVQPVLRALPPAESVRGDGPRSGNPDVRAALARGEPQIVAWTIRRGNGARGFGFTGGHFHRNWYDPAFRRLVLNGLIWAAGLEVPAAGVPAPEPSIPLYATIDEAIARGDLADVRRHVATDPQAARGAAGARLSPLHQAILRRQTAIVLLLLENGADVNAPDSSGRTPLHLAVERDDAAVVRELLARRADPARRDKIGWTPLHHAAAKNRLEIARLILDAGADPNLRSERGGTPLHEAAASGGAELIGLLLERGTDPSIRSHTGVTALDIARQFKNEAAIAALEARAPSDAR